MEQIERAGERWPGYLEVARRTTLNAHYTDPAIIAPAWQFLRHVGVTDEHIGWEPGAGTGLWMADPAAIPMRGVELDPVSAAIGNHLIPPGSRIDHANLTDARLPEEGPADQGYDLVVGNVPFASVVPHAKDNPDRLRLHNYALVKAARMTRPGGYLVLVTSRYTLDATNPQVREQLAAHTNLVAAFRLPTDAHLELAGTSVVTDLLVMHRPTDPAQLTGWPEPTPVPVEDTTVLVSSHYLEHPDRVLGTYALGGMRQGDDLRVLHPEAHPGGYLPQLEALLDDLATTAPTLSSQGQAPAVADRATAEVGSLPPGSIIQTGPTSFQRLTSTGREDLRVPATQRAELAALCELRDLVRDVLAADAAQDPAAPDLRAELNGAYDRYAGQYGPLNRFELRARSRSSALDPGDASDVEAGEVAVETRRIYPKMGGFRTDPGWWSVAALEVFDDETQSVTPAPLLAGPVARTADYPSHVDDPTEAVQVLLARDGAVTLPAVAELASIDVDEAEQWLGDQVYRDPTDPTVIVPAPVYLSGLVREKLAAAEAAAATDPGFARNVEALQAVQPRWIPAEEITARIGASWIPPADLEQFLGEELHLPNATVLHVPELATWAISAGGYSAENEYTYAVAGRRKAVDLLEDIANQRATRITTEVDGRRVLDIDATAAATAKRGELEDLFTGWVWGDPERCERLARVYNDRFNAYVEPRWPGDSLHFTGLASTFEPRPHQRDAVARILGDRDRGTLLAHTVGAGKTGVMAISAMELRRLGISQGPVGIVVPNSMLQQFAREFLQLYPQANVLVADQANLAKDQRREFVARAASGAYDVVLFTHTSFTTVAPSPATIEAATGREVDAYRRALTAVTNLPGQDRAQGRAVKQIETAIANLEERLAKLSDRARHDDGTVTFEELGLGHLMVDEAHLAKNLSFPTRIEAVQVRESARARDLLIKVDWMREQRGDGAITFATATPITNQISEMWVFSRFLEPEGLRRAGVEHFDAWAANFAATVTAVEVAPTGVGFRTVSRFSKFTNVPELSRSFRAFADVRTADQLQLPRPAVAGGAPTTVTLDGDDALGLFMGSLVKRSEKVKGARRPERGEDNMLAIASDGRVGALDMRLATRSTGYTSDDGPSPKIDRAAEEIARRYHQHADRRYKLDDGTPHPVPGATQIVFCDHGVPGNAHRDVYADLTQALVARGVPAGKIAAVQSAKSHEARAQLFRSVREGQVAVLIGSTASMGVGVNVQTRLIASHILTPPWRPDGVEQAEGRILRQGNQNDEVELLRYVTEGSYDAYSWQTIERKARFISQVMTSPDQLGREMVDEDAVADEYAVLKAIATGDPRILAAAQLESRVASLERSKAVHERSARLLSSHLNASQYTAQRDQATAERLTPLLAAHRPDANATLYRPDDTTTVHPAGKPGLAEALGTHLATITAERPAGDQQSRRIATIEGIPVIVAFREGLAHVAPEGVDHPALERTFQIRELRYGEVSYQGVGQATINLVHDLPRRLEQLTDSAAHHAQQAADIETRLAAPFPHDDELTDLRQQLGTLQAELMVDQEHTEPTPQPPAPSRNPARPTGRSYLVPPRPAPPTRPGSGFDR